MQTDSKIQNHSGFYRLTTVLEKFPVSRSAWWAGVKSGKYPAAIKLAPNTTAWRRTDIDGLCSSLEKGGAQ